MSFNRLANDTLGVSHPTLAAVDHDAVRKFLGERKKYLSQIEERNVTLSKKDAILPVSLKSSCAAGVWRTAIDELDVESEDEGEVTEDQVLDWLEEQAPSHVASAGPSWLRDLFKSRLRDPGPGKGRDIVARLLSMKVAFFDLYEAYSLRQTFKDKAALRMLNEVLSERTKHSGFVHSLKDQWQAFGEEGQKTRTDLKAFWKTAGRVASEQRRQDSILEAAAKTVPPVLGKRRERTDRDHVGEKGHKKGPGVQKGCWGCGQPHKLQDCPNARGESDRRPAVRSRGGGRARSAGTTESQAVEVVFNDYRSTAILDSGANTTYLDRETAEAARMSWDPVRATVSLADGGTSMATLGKGEVDVRLLTEVGETVVRRANAVVVEGRMPHPLLGADLLSSLEIDPRSRLVIKHQSGAYANVFDFMRPHTEGLAPPSCRAILDEDERALQVEVPLTIDQELEAMIQRSVGKGGLADAEAKQLRDLVMEFRDIWRVEILPEDGPAKIEPMEHIPKADARPKRAPMRKYNRMERRFLENMTRRLLKSKAIFRNKRSVWSSPSLVVRKPGKSGLSDKDYRWTVDLRHVNDSCESIAAAMPVLEQLVEHLEGSEVYATVDCFKGFWQFPLHEASQEMLSFLTHEGVFTPTRLLQGHKDSAAAFQLGMQEAVGPELLYSAVLIYIDDLLCHAKSVGQLLVALRKLFERMRAYNIKLSPSKSNLVLREVKWCGRIIDKEGIRFDNHMVSGLVDMERPHTAQELQQLLCGANWLRVSLPGYAAVVSKLQEKLKDSQRSVGSSKGRKLRNSALTWTKEEMEVLAEFKKLVAGSVKQAHLRMSEEWVLCLMADASINHWGVVLTQVPGGDLEKPMVEQRHEALAFLSGTFKGNECGWAIIEKEAFAIICGVRKLRGFLSVKKFRLFTDHRNLVYLFHTKQKETDCKRHVKDRLQRWYLELASFTYTIEHVEGKNNFWADLLSRWKVARICYVSKGTRNPKSLSTGAMGGPATFGGGVSPSVVPYQTCASRECLLTTNVVDPVLLSSHASNTMAEHACSVRGVEVSKVPLPGAGSSKPRAEKSVKRQIQFSEDEFELLKQAIQGTGAISFSEILAEIRGLKKDGLGRMVVEDKELRARLICLAHGGLSGHSGVERTRRRLEDTFAWESLGSDVELFCKRCIHCLAMQDARVKTLYAEQLHAGERNAVLHYDFLYIEPGFYVLVIKDDFSHFCELVPCTNADHEVVVEALLAWYSRFGLKSGQIHISDNGSHFKNSVIELLGRTLGFQQRFTPAYSPWANGTVEIVNRLLVKILRSLKSEFKVDDARPLLTVVQAALNLNEAPSLGNRSPSEVFTLMKGEPFAVAFDRSELKVLDKPASACYVADAVEGLRGAMEIMHKKVSDFQSMSREQKRRSRNRRRNALPSYQIGDFVLVWNSRPSGKLDARFTGPWRVSKTVSPHVFQVEHLLSPVEKIVHVEKLLPYSAKDFTYLKELKEHVQFHKKSYEVEKILEIKDDVGLVQWQGFDAHEATWEPLETLQEDVPDLVKACIENDM